MGLVKRGNIWWIQIRRNGKRIQKSTGLTDRKQAEAVEQVVMLAYTQKPPRAGIEALLDSIYGTEEESVITFESAYMAYTDVLRASNKMPSKKVQCDRKSNWDSLAAWANEHATDNVLSFTRNQAGAFVHDLAQTDKKDKTRRNIIANIQTVWKSLSTQYELKPVWDGLLPVVKDAAVREGFTREEEERIMEAAKQYHDGRWYLPCMIARHTGLRLSSIRALEWGEIGEDWVLRHIPIKTKAHNIAVTMPIVEPLLSELIDKRGKPEEKVIKSNLDKEYPFKAVLRLADINIGIRTFHSWRHTFCSRLSEAGVSDDIVKRLGGWTQDKTRQRYDHAERIEEMAEALGKAK